jgi:glycosyltransferase involved in cell wall biosynthesis
LADALNFGGTERQMVEVAKRLNGDAYRVTVGCLRLQGPFVRTLQEAGIRVFEFCPHGGFFSASGALAMLRLARFLRRGRFDVMHAHELYSDLMGVPAAWLARIPVIVSSRRDLANWWWYTPRRRRILRHVQSFSTFVLANSDAVREMLVNEDRFPPKLIRVVRNGVDFEAFTGSLCKTDARRELFPECGRDDKLVVVVANMHSRAKGHFELIEAARMVCNALPTARFLLVGDGAERRALEDRSRELGLAANIRFLGHRSDVAQVLKCCDLSVLPSWGEGMPNVVLESMAAGLPVVATRVGGTTEAIEDGISGLLVPPQDVRALAGAMLRLLQDAALAASLARAGEERVRQHYSFERVVLQLTELYREGKERRARHRGARSAARMPA